MGLVPLGIRKDYGSAHDKQNLNHFKIWTCAHCAWIFWQSIVAHNVGESIMVNAWVSGICKLFCN